MARYVRYAMTDSQITRAKMYLLCGGFHYKVIAARIFGNGKKGYVASNAEVARIGQIARDNKMSSRDWRNGETPEAKRLLNRIGNCKRDTKPQLRVVA